MNTIKMVFLLQCILGFFWCGGCRNYLSSTYVISVSLNFTILVFFMLYENHKIAFF